LPNSKRLRIAGPALRDLEAIAEFTEEKWGARQKSQYLDAIREKFEEILQTPGLGAPRDYVRPGLRACPAGAYDLLPGDGNRGRCAASSSSTD